MFNLDKRLSVENHVAQNMQRDTSALIASLVHRAFVIGGFFVFAGIVDPFSRICLASVADEARAHSDTAMKAINPAHPSMEMISIRSMRVIGAAVSHCMQGGRFPCQQRPPIRDGIAKPLSVVSRYGRRVVMPTPQDA